MNKSMIVTRKEVIDPVKRKIWIFHLKKDVEEVTKLLEEKIVDKKQWQDIELYCIEDGLTDTLFKQLNKLVKQVHIFASPHLSTNKSSMVSFTFLMGLLKGLPAVKTYVYPISEASEKEVERILQVPPLSFRQISKFSGVDTDTYGQSDKYATAHFAVWMHVDAEDQAIVQICKDVSVGISVLCFGLPQALKREQFQPYWSDANKMSKKDIVMGNSIKQNGLSGKDYYKLQIDFSLPVHDVLGVAFKPFLMFRQGEEKLEHIKSLIKVLSEENRDFTTVNETIIDERGTERKYVKMYFFLPLDDGYDLQINDFNDEALTTYGFTNNAFAKYGIRANFLFPK
jgi:hypothetical protein